MSGPGRCVVLLLPGGKPVSVESSHAYQLANLRMRALGWALRRRLGPRAGIRLVQYRLRGWNRGGIDALADAERALDGVRARWPGRPVVLVGHSMGARVAAHLARHDGVRAVVALAPWWPKDDSARIPTDRALLVVHGTADTRTDPRASRSQTERAQQRGQLARWVGLPGAGHSMMSDLGRWHGLTADFISAQAAA